MRVVKQVVPEGRRGAKRKVMRMSVLDLDLDSSDEKQKKRRAKV